MISSVWLHLQRVEWAVSPERRDNPVSSCCLCVLQSDKNKFSQPNTTGDGVGEGGTQCSHQRDRMRRSGKKQDENKQWIINTYCCIEVLSPMLFFFFFLIVYTFVCRVAWTMCVQLMGFINFVVAPFLEIIDNNTETSLAEPAKETGVSSSLLNLPVTLAW